MWLTVGGVQLNMVRLVVLLLQYLTTNASSEYLNGTVAFLRVSEIRMQLICTHLHNGICTGLIYTSAVPSLKMALRHILGYHRKV